MTEVMIVVVLIGTLATFAVPVYRDYGIRAEILEVISLARKDMQLVEEYMVLNGVPANSSQITSLNSSIAYITTSSNLVSATSMSEQGLTINISGPTLPAGLDIELVYFFSTENNAISWHCAYGDGTTSVSNSSVPNADKVYLPKDCSSNLLSAHPNYTALF